MLTVTVSPKFQIIIPKLIRQKLDIQPGQKLQIVSFDGRIEYVPIKNIRDMRGFLKGINTSVERDRDRI